MSIPPIQTGQTGPIIRGTDGQESRRAALQAEPQPQRTGAASTASAPDSFEPSSVNVIDARSSAHLRRVAAQQQAPVLAPIQPPTPQGTNGLIEAEFHTPPPPNRPAPPTDATPDPVPPSLTPDAAPDSPQPLPSDGVPRTPTDPDTPVTFANRDIARLVAAFGLTKGEDGFVVDLDFNGDGVINGVDLANLLNNLNPSGSTKPADVAPTGPQSLVEGVLEAFGSSLKEGGPNSAYDLNGDGVIDGRDLAAALAQARSGDSDPVKSGESGNGATLKSLLAAFGKSEGQKGFAGQVDLNGDGVVNGADLAQYLAQIRDTA